MATPKQQGVSHTPCWMHVRRIPNSPFQAEQIEERTIEDETVITIRTKIYRDGAGRMRFQWKPSGVLLVASPQEQQADPTHRFTMLILPMRAAFRVTGMGTLVDIPKGQLVREDHALDLDFPIFAEYKNPQHTIRVENIQRGEPDPSLFAIPTEYAIYTEPEELLELAGGA